MNERDLHIIDVVVKRSHVNEHRDAVDWPQLAPFRGGGCGARYRQLRSEALLAAGYSTGCLRHQEVNG